MESCFYEGVVRHRRFQPVSHAFRYRLFMAYVDLSELNVLFARRGLWSLRRPAVARFCRSDYVGDPRRPLEDCVRELVQEQLGWKPAGPIRLLTHLRTFGFQMNPVSFYFCFDEAGRAVEALVAEVNNTPWGERHHYVLDLRTTPQRDVHAATTTKELHVSPFLPMALQYDWRISFKGQRLLIHLGVRQRQATLLDATLAMRRQPLSAGNRLRLRYPWMTARVYLGIHWQALRLWWKGVPLVPHPARAPSAAAEPRDNTRIHQAAFTTDAQRTVQRESVSLQDTNV